MNKKNKYLLYRITHFLSGLFLSFYYSFIYTRRKKIIIFNSSCNQDFTWNAKSLFLNGKDEFRQLGYKVFFVITDDKKRKYLTNQYGNYFIGNRSIKERHLIYTSAIWVLSTLETPCSGVFLNRARFVFHLGHGTPIKNIGLCEKKPSILKKIFYKLNDTNISLYLSTSDFFLPYMARVFNVSTKKIITSPQPRLADILKKERNTKFQFDSNKKYILYAPTWRPYSGITLFPFDGFNIEKFNEYLKKSNIIILLRLHPRFEGDLTEYLRSNIINYNTELCPDISESLNLTDAIITDYSSIYCDYLVLNKPVAVLPYDIEEYTRQIGFSHDYEDIFPECLIKSEHDLKQFCQSIHNYSFDTRSQSLLCEKLNFIPINTDITKYNINIIDKEYKIRWKRK
ncbi:CDP-glycerol glycerophosphotransferase family protein [Providencia rettgeri]|nr:CDP-glycerol glycerophosphotransferase family protein [Providencia rettgeri]